MSNFLNVMDKGFFGKSMAEYAKQNISKISKSVTPKLDSIDDFNKYFEGFKSLPKMERMPNNDTFQLSLDKFPSVF